MSEEDLIGRAMAGDEAAFTAVYRREQGPVFRFALRMSGSEAVAEEVTQEAFLLLIREPRAYRPERGALGGFLLGVARNLVLRHLARQSRVVVLDDQGGLEPPGEPARDFERRDEIELVRRAVENLPVRYREVVVLCDLGEASYEEAAQALECPVGTVRSRLSRARALLKAKLAGARESTRWVA